MPQLEIETEGIIETFTNFLKQRYYLMQFFTVYSEILSIVSKTSHLNSNLSCDRAGNLKDRGIWH